MSRGKTIQLRQDWKLGNSPISNLLELIEEKGIKIFEISLEKDSWGCQPVCDDFKIKQTASPQKTVIEVKLLFDN